MVIKLASFLRYSLDQDSRTITTVGEELQNIENYLAIEKIRFSSRLEYVRNIEEQCLQCTLPALILQPLFENAIKHGVYNSTGTITISLDIRRDKDFLKVILKNNFDEPGPLNSGGIGLVNIKNRMILLYQRKDLFSVYKSKNSFEVLLSIPQT
jgi:two-component system, LytTR family, sensor kinase